MCCLPDGPHLGSLDAPQAGIQRLGKWIMHASTSGCWLSACSSLQGPHLPFPYCFLMSALQLVPGGPTPSTQREYRCLLSPSHGRARASLGQVTEANPSAGGVSMHSCVSSLLQEVTHMPLGFPVTPPSSLYLLPTPP